MHSKTNRIFEKWIYSKTDYNHKHGVERKLMLNVPYRKRCKNENRSNIEIYISLRVHVSHVYLMEQKKKTGQKVRHSKLTY